MGCRRDWRHGWEVKGVVGVAGGGYGGRSVRAVARARPGRGARVVWNRNGGGRV